MSVSTSSRVTPSRSTGLRSRSATVLSSSQSRAATAAASAAGNQRSQVEQAVVSGKTPLKVSSRDKITAGQYSGIHLNKQEEAQFRGPLPLSRYSFSNDPNPEVIRKPSGTVKYVQQVSTRHLKPPTPSPHGDLIIRERPKQVPAAPPAVVRQEGRRAATPPPLVHREQPPRPPTRLPTQVLEIEGEPGQPPARKVVLEKLPDQPAKPQNIVIEKWLPYQARSRRVVLERVCVPPPPPTRNLIVEWQAPCVEVEQQCVDLGVCRADPCEYVKKYGNELKKACEIPDLCRDGCQSARRSASVASFHTSKLEGDLDALRRVPADALDAQGLGEYRRFL